MTIGKGLRSSSSRRRRSSPSWSTRCRWRSTRRAASGSRPGRTIRTGSRRRRWTTSCSSSKTPTATARPTSARSSPAISTTRPASSSTTAACSSPRQPNLVFLKDTNGDDKYDIEGASPAAASTPPTRTTRSTASRSIRAARSTSRKASSIARRSSRRGARSLRQADGGVFRFEPRTWKFEIYIPMNFPNPHGHVFDRWGQDIVFDGTGGQPFYGPSFSTKKYYPAMETKRRAEPGQRTDAPGRRRRNSSRAGTFPEDDAGQPDRAQRDRLPGAAQLQADRGRRRAQVDGSRADLCRPPTRTSGRSTRRSAPTARSTSSTGTTRSSATCSTTCATRPATTSTAASTASRTLGGRCSSRR